MLAPGLLNIALILKHSQLVLTSPRPIWWRHVEIWQILLHIEIMWFMPFSVLIWILHLFIYACWNNLAFLGWNSVGHNVWSSYVTELTCNYIMLRTSASLFIKKITLKYSFYIVSLLALVGSNTDFIGWIWLCSFTFYFEEQIKENW